MSTWTLIQIVFDLFMACGLFVVVMRMNRAPKDDPRLSRGLALLQSKISVLEDLSDRTEAQVASMIAVLESKAREVQAKVELADRHVAEIRVSMDRSLEVASIFQDKIPHKEIIERQNTIKYVQAARMAHSGLSLDEIAARVDLPRGELEFIASVNRERLMFSEDELPEWARGSESTAGGSAPASSQSAGGGMIANAATDAGASFGGAPNMFASSMNGMAFDETAQAHSAQTHVRPQAQADQTQAVHAQTSDAEMTNEERARRLRAEIELAENQRLVENLSRLQTEMQNLDQQLARDANPRTVAAAYEVPKVETDHLKKLGEEFRRAVREGEAADNKVPFGSGSSSMFPPIERLSSLIPNILEAGAVEDAVTPQPTPAQGPSPATPSVFAQLAAAQANAQAAPRAAASSVQPQRAAAHQTPTPAAVAPKDPVLARAVAQAKVQAALRSSAKPTSVVKPENVELQQARAVARDLAGNIVPPAKPGEVRKIAFPRIDGTDL